jgi:hypothetical protein
MAAPIADFDSFERNRHCARSAGRPDRGPVVAAQAFFIGSSAFYDGESYCGPDNTFRFEALRSRQGQAEAIFVITYGTHGAGRAGRAPGASREDVKTSRPNHACGTS